MSRPKTVFEPYTDPKNSPFRQQKVKTDSKIKSKSKVRIEENVEKYTGLEHRQTLKAWDFNCDLQIEIESYC